MSLKDKFDIQERLRAFGLICLIVMVGMVIYHVIFARPKPKEIQPMYTILECLEMQLIEESMKRNRERQGGYDHWEDF